MPGVWRVAVSLLENLFAPALVQTLFSPVCSCSCSDTETSCSYRILLRILNHAFRLHFFPFSFASIPHCVCLSNTCLVNSPCLPARLFACSSSRNAELKFMKFYIPKWGHAVTQLIEALRYKLEGRGFHSRWFNWNFLWTKFFRPGLTQTNRNEYQRYLLGSKDGRCVLLTPYRLHVPTILKSGNLSFILLEPSVLVQG